MSSKSNRSSSTTTSVPVEFNGQEYASISERNAHILFKNKNDVFYNPVQETNRDLSVAVLRQFVKLRHNEREESKKAKNAKSVASGTTNSNNTDTKSTQQSSSSDMKIDDAVIAPTIKKTPLKVLEALSATGLRSIRYAQEVDGLGKIIANDIDSAAVEAIKRNVEFNKMSAKVIANHGDATEVLYSHRSSSKRFDVIDLDPYGTVSPFIDGAVQSINDGGLLLVTCTDMQTLAGGLNPEACFTKYGSAIVKGTYCHEMALRIVLQSLSTAAARYKKSIEPLLSLSIDFYVRMFVRVHSSPIRAKQAITKSSMVHQCVDCDTFVLQPLGQVFQNSRKNNSTYKAASVVTTQRCPTCEGRVAIGGPIWNAALHNKTFVSNVMDELVSNSQDYGTGKKAHSLTFLALNELETPLSYQLNNLCRRLRIVTPSNLKFRSAILAQNYNISLCHTSPKNFKTDAPPNVVWDILRCWAKTGSNSNLNNARATGKKILEKKPEVEADFTPSDAARKLDQRPKYSINPEHWGPGSRARRRDAENDKIDVPAKRRKNDDSTTIKNKEE